jgi:hypothetical protein
MGAVSSQRSAVSGWILRFAIALVTVFVPLELATGDDRPPHPRGPIPVEAESTPLGDVVIVVGAPGTEEYGRMFAEWAALWERAAREGQCRVTRIGDGGDASDDRVKTALRQTIEAAVGEAALPFWLVLIGHGTFDARSAKFNLAGEDVSDTELGVWLDPLARPVAILNCASSSGAFVEALSVPGRVVVTATRGGDEVNFARFGGALAKAIGDTAADLDKDGQVSLLEAFLKGSREIEEFYTGDNRLATEHALIDDNGDGRGTRAAGFDGVRPIRDAEAADALDGYAAHQWRLVPSEAERRFPADLRPRRDALERSIFELRDRKGEFTEAEYFARLESLLLELARLYEEAERGGLPPDEPRRGTR